ncbi:MAG: uncharacterized protein JWM47_1354 [Acidimicrobiales bacterium]|nr:uncharacterized protein [Acidimicrobiales bacterium]
MDGGGERAPGGRPARLTAVVPLVVPLVVALLVLVVMAGCGSSSATDVTSRSADTEGRGDRPAGGAGSSTTTGAVTAETAGPIDATAPAPATDTTATTGTGDGTGPGSDDDLALEGFATTGRSAPAGGDGTALLRDVRVGSHDGYDRVVFEFAGSVVPGYRVDWLDGEALADASGEVVPVAGVATLAMVLQPASGVDMDTGRTVYTGPDRLTIAPSAGVLRDVVRTGDFEAVLSWAFGTDQRGRFRVSTLSFPPRVVVDVRKD